MHQFDSVLKEILLASATSLPAWITGSNVTEWLNVEMPEVKAGRLDLVGWLENRTLLHGELQSGNDREMVFRMLEAVPYLARLYGVLPWQFVLYLGLAPMRMGNSLASHQMNYRVDFIDIRDFRSETLLRSPLWGDHLLALLGSHEDDRATVRGTLLRISRLGPRRRADMLAKLMVIAGLRKAEAVVLEESRKMAVHIDPMENEVLRMWHDEAVAKGLSEGLDRGRAEGLRAAKVEMLTRLLEKKFGHLPGWALVRVNEMSGPELDDAAIRVFDAAKIDELLGPATRPSAS